MVKPLSTAVVLWLCTAAFADPWPAWRGPTGDGRCAEKNLPTHWSATENVRWKTPLPGPGNSTPVVWGERIFLTQATDRGRVRSVLCFGRGDGKLLWQRDTEYKDKEPSHLESNPYCSASPVTDGERVIASFGSAGLVCYDFAGKLLWKKDVGKLTHLWGNASSPVLYGELVILWCGPGERQSLMAVDRTTGAKVWEHAEPRKKPEDNDEPDDWLGTWATPLVVRSGERDELVLPVPGAIKGFDPRTGKELWWCGGLGGCVYGSPVHSKGVVIAMAGCNGATIAVKVGGKGDVTATHQVWRNRLKQPQRIGSPVAIGDHIFTVTEAGFAQRYELQTGTEFWDQHRGIAGRAYASLVHADGKLYVPTLDGVTLVLKAGPKFEVLAKNDIGERVLASPAISDGEIFLRSHKHLWCIRTKK
ncbi:MAG: PQQ-binding-like beta-propeller repeat protein [Gemmataceae bacterium]|nr:PQQ-binding-like beta-propeller repeat protein [Gemmataceae bacterium]